MTHHGYEIERLYQLEKDVTRALTARGYSALVVTNHTAETLERALRNVGFEDWRDAYLAAIAGGVAVTRAGSVADAAARDLAERRADMSAPVGKS